MKRRLIAGVAIMGALIGLGVFPRVLDASVPHLSPATPNPFELVVPGGTKEISVRAERAVSLNTSSGAVRKMTFEGDVVLHLPGKVRLRIPKDKVMWEHDKTKKVSRFYIIDPSTPVQNRSHVLK